MSIKSTLISDQNPLFLVVAVPPPVLDNRAKAEQTIRYFQARLSGLPTALVTRDAHGAPIAYYGRGDLAVRLLHIGAAALVWKDLPFC